MKVTLCDKCGRQCNEHWTIHIKGIKGTVSAERDADLCASCVFVLSSLLPDYMHVVIPTKERVELFEREYLKNSSPGEK